MKAVTTEIIGEAYGTDTNEVDNIELLEVNNAIRFHGVEQVGAFLREAMTAMKAINVGKEKEELAFA